MTLPWPLPPLQPVSEELQARLEALEMQKQYQAHADAFLGRRVEQFHEELRAAKEASGLCAMLQQQVDHLERRELAWSQHAGALEAAREADRREAEGWRRDMAQETDRMRADLERLLQLQAQHDAERFTHEHTNLMHKEAVAECERLQERVLTLQMEHQTAAGSAAEMEQLQGEVWQLRAELQDHRTLRQAEHAKLQDDVADQQRSREEADALHRHEYDAFRDEAARSQSMLQAQTRQLQDELNVMTSELNDSRQSRCSTEQELVRIREDAESHYRSRLELEAEIDEVRRAHEDIEGKLVQHRHAREEAERSQGIANMELDVLKQEQHRTSAESHHMQKRLEEAAGDAAEQTRLREAFQASYSSVERETFQLRDQAASMAAAHKRSLDELHATHRGLEEEVQSERRQRKESEMRHDAAQAQVQALTGRLETLLEELQLAESERGREVRLREETEQKLSVALEKNAGLEERNRADRVVFEAREKLNSVAATRVASKTSTRAGKALRSGSVQVEDGFERVRSSVSTPSRFSIGGVGARRTTNLPGAGIARASLLPVDLLSFQAEDEKSEVSLGFDLLSPSPRVPRTSVREPSAAVAPRRHGDSPERKIPIDLSSLDLPK